MAKTTKKSTDTKLSDGAKELLTQLQRSDVDYTTVDDATYQELFSAGLARVHFGLKGNQVFATDAGKSAK